MYGVYGATQQPPPTANNHQRSFPPPSKPYQKGNHKRRGGGSIIIPEAPNRRWGCRGGFCYCVYVAEAQKVTQLWSALAGHLASSPHLKRKKGNKKGILSLSCGVGFRELWHNFDAPLSSKSFPLMHPFWLYIRKGKDRTLMHLFWLYIRKAGLGNGHHNNPNNNNQNNTFLA